MSKCPFDNRECDSKEDGIEYSCHISFMPWMIAPCVNPNGTRKRNIREDVLNITRLKKLRDKKLSEFNSRVEDIRSATNVHRSEFDRVYLEVLSGDIEVLNAILDDIAELEELEGDK